MPPKGRLRATVPKGQPRLIVANMETEAMSTNARNLMDADTLQYDGRTAVKPVGRLDLYDVGWIILCIGMAIGSGIIFLPIQVGLKGIWVFALSLVFAYPAVYFLQELYLKSLMASKKADSYSGIVGEYLGKNWGVALGILYFTMLLKGMLSYSLIVTFDSASYLKAYGVTTELLSDKAWYALIVLSALVLIAAQGERLLFKVAGPMVVMKLAIVIILGIAIVPHWDFSNWGALPSLGPLVRDTFLTLPFTLFSILFVQILSPMNIAYRKKYSDVNLANLKVLRANRIAYAILVVSVLFFVFSFSLGLSHKDAVVAYEKNISVLALMAEVIPGATIHVMGTALSIFAIFTGFFGLFLGFQDAVTGIVINILSRFMEITERRRKMASRAITISLIVLLAAWVQLGVSILLLVEIGGPLYAVVACWIPCYLVFKMKSLHGLKGWKVYFVAFFGLLLFISPFMKLFS